MPAMPTDFCFEMPTPAKVQPSRFTQAFDACEKVLAEREAQYKGSAGGMFGDIGALADMLMPHPASPAIRAAATLLALKLIRMRANPAHADSLTDCINYLCFFNEALTKETTT
jgi:hypothetical protein